VRGWTGLHLVEATRKCQVVHAKVRDDCGKHTSFKAAANGLGHCFMISLRLSSDVSPIFLANVFILDIHDAPGLCFRFLCRGHAEAAASRRVGNGNLQVCCLSAR